MKLSVQEIRVSPPGSRSSKGIGWSEVFVHLNDDESGVLPSVTLKVHVPYKDSDSYGVARERALDRAKGILKAALEALEGTSVEEIDRK